MLRLRDIDVRGLRELLRTRDVQLAFVAEDAPIPGSYWGDPEAGLIGCTVFVRSDTPVHSALHEACHLIVMPTERRAHVHTNATDSIAEEDAACYLQIVLADALADVGSERLMIDMDEWGYTFRLGSTRAWYESDALDTRQWLLRRAIIPEKSSAETRGAMVE